MNESFKYDSNTPIFDSLVAERGYIPKFPPHLVRPFQFRPVENFSRLEEVHPGGVVPLRLAKADPWIAQVVPRITPDEPETNVKLSANVHPEEAEQSSCGGMYGFVQARIKEFGAKHPDATNVTVSSIPEDDGTVTIQVVGYEPKTEKIPQDLAARQLEVYKGLGAYRGLTLDPSTIRTHDENENTCTYDEVVEAIKAVTAPRPLFVSDEEADEME